MFDTDALRRAIDDIYRYPLRQSTVDTLNRQLRTGVSDDMQLAELVVSLREDDRLCQTDSDEAEAQDPQIICSMGLFDQRGEIPMTIAVERPTAPPAGF